MLTLVGQNLQTFKNKDVGTGANVLHLDLTCNCFTSGKELSVFPNLRTLVLDDNQLEDLSDFPVLKHLETFSANKNNLCNLDQFLDDAFDRFGKLKNLSLLKNPLNPYFEDEHKYSVYRDKVLDRFPNLKTLDGCAVEIIMKDVAAKRKAEEEKYETIKANIVVDEKYKDTQVKSVKTKSEGNRYLKNHQL